MGILYKLTYFGSSELIKHTTNLASLSYLVNPHYLIVILLLGNEGLAVIISTKDFRLQFQTDLHLIFFQFNVIHKNDSTNLSCSQFSLIH